MPFPRRLLFHRVRDVSNARSHGGGRAPGAFPARRDLGRRVRIAPTTLPVVSRAPKRAILSRSWDGAARPFRAPLHRVALVADLIGALFFGALIRAWRWDAAAPFGARRRVPEGSAATAEGHCAPFAMCDLFTWRNAADV
ncbi:hypothetical protein MRX96_047436 [Rhipicephalus microplus]